MDFLLQPDIAYLVLLSGILITLMAIVTPGTGLLEVCAFFSLVLSGYSVYNLSINWWALIMLILSVLPFVYAIQKPKREIFLGASIFLLMLGSIFLYAADDWKPAVNPVLAFISSSLTTAFLWIAVRKTIQAAAASPSNTLESLIGVTGKARININGEGSVQVGGELWSARSEKSIPAGSKIRVVRREGFTLVVEKVG